MLMSRQMLKTFSWEKFPPQNKHFFICAIFWKRNDVVLFATLSQRVILASSEAIGHLLKLCRRFGYQRGSCSAGGSQSLPRWEIHDFWKHLLFVLPMTDEHLFLFWERVFYIGIFVDTAVGQLCQITIRTLDAALFCFVVRRNCCFESTEPPNFRRKQQLNKTFFCIKLYTNKTLTKQWKETLKNSVDILKVTVYQSSHNSQHWKAHFLQ